MFMDIDRYQITMDGETLFNGEFYKNLFINIYNHTGRGAEKFVETRRYYVPKNQWLMFLHFLEECPQRIAVDSVESLLKLPDGTRIKRFEVKGVPY